MFWLGIPNNPKTPLLIPGRKTPGHCRRQTDPVARQNQTYRGVNKTGEEKADKKKGDNFGGHMDFSRITFSCHAKGFQG